MKFILILFLVQIAVSAQTRKVTFFVNTDIPDSAIVWITGNTDTLGQWNPSAVPLNHIGAGKWSRQFNFDLNDTILYKFTLGDWEHEALDDSGNVPPNNKLIIESDTIVTFNIKLWGKHKVIESRITGTAVYIKDFKVPELKSRNIVIWLPPDYYKSSRRYPVLYAHDGQNIIDPGTSAWGVDWRMDETADSLIRNGNIEPIIIVGIYNTADRSAEYSDTDKGQAYIKFIINQLKPLIDSTYRTLSDKENTAVIGSSMGGLISFIMLWEYSDFFSKGACLSPAFVYKNYDYTKKVGAYKGARHPLKVYFYNGGKGLEQELQPGIDKMLGILNELGYKEGKDYIWDCDPEAEHTEAAWAERFPVIIKYLFGKE